MNIYTIENMIEDKLPGKVEKPTINLPVDKMPTKNELVNTDGVKSQEEPPIGNQSGPQGETGPPGEMGSKGETGPQGEMGSDGSSTTTPIFSNYVWKWPNISFNTRPHNRIVYRDTQIIEKDTSNPLIYLIIGIGITILLVVMLRR